MDPSLFDGVREQLVAGFARRIFDATPDVAEFIETGVAEDAFPGQRSIERAAKMLPTYRRDLQTQVSVSMRRNLDAKFLPLLDPVRKVRLSLDGLTLMAALSLIAAGSTGGGDTGTFNADI